MDKSVEVSEIKVPLQDILSIAGEFERAGRNEDALRLLDHILAAAPLHPDALHLSGIVAFRQGLHHDALDKMQRAIANGIDTPLYLRNICEIYRTLGRLDDALETATRAHRLAPSDPLCLHNLAIIHYERLEIEACIDCARAALVLDPTLPGAHFELAEALLLSGEFAAGWEEYEWRYRIAGAAPMMPPTDRPQWSGSTIVDEKGDEGTLLLIADQGFGDVIQFSRYIPWALARCPNIAVASSVEMHPVLRQVSPDLRLFQRWEDCPNYHAFCPLSGLPRLHGTRLGAIPAPIPYLTADPIRRKKWADRIDALSPPGFKKLGIAWAGRPTHNNDRNRSARLADFAPLTNLPQTALFSVQKGPATGQAGDWFSRIPLINLGAEIEDYDDTLAILANLDLLITVDTSVAHLAGASGRPVWVMLPRAPDWRWLLDRSDTPWYPSMRLFRQTESRDWRSVAEQIVSAFGEACPTTAE